SLYSSFLTLSSRRRSILPRSPLFPYTTLFRSDPLIEADAYLAYGRDLQAEEVLKEALRTQPERLALHQKLADIHAKRQDRKAFEIGRAHVLNSSHVKRSYAVFCLNKKKIEKLK